MSIFKTCTVSALTAITLGCTKGTPDFATLGTDNIPQPLFAGQKETTLGANSPTATFAISGDCDPKIRDITGSIGALASFSSLNSFSVGAVTVSCSSTGHFSFTLKSLTDLGITPVTGQTYNVLLRAVTSGGVSNPSTIHIAYSTTGGPDPRRIMITSGSTENSTSPTTPRLAVGTNFKAEIRVGNKINNYTPGTTVTDAMSLKSGTVYKMRAGIASQD